MPWEYKTIKIETTGIISSDINIFQFNDMLNKLGRDDWELVSTFDTNTNGYSHYVIAILKRQSNIKPKSQ